MNCVVVLDMDVIRHVEASSSFIVQRGWRLFRGPRIHPVAAPNEHQVRGRVPVWH